MRVKTNGYILIQVIIFSAITAYLLGALTGWSIIDIKSSRYTENREMAIQIAEAGIDYYRWHLAHAPTDYQDGTGEDGPYIHDFLNKDNEVIGQFTLNITPPSLGSSLVVIESTGQTNANPDITRTIITRLAKPSIAKYAVVANSSMRFGEGTEVFGPIHSNGGIRFDGLAHNIISSGVSTYDDPDHSGGLEFGVHTHASPIDPLPPAELPIRGDIFEAGRQFPVPQITFTGMTADIAQMKTDAVADGFYGGSSGSLGYEIILHTNDRFDLYKVTSFTSAPHGCSSSGQSGWGTWSIKKETSLGNYPFPNNGIIFLEDNIFVRGQIDSARLTIIAAVLPDSISTRKNIIINKDLLYTTYDGSDVIGLIAQGDITVGLESEDDLRIDAALIAQNGRIGRYYYESDCTPYDIRNSITLWGMLATNLRYGFAYTNDTGYITRTLNYDSSMLYGPPPNFPLTSDQYVTLSWEEVK